MIKFIADFVLGVVSAFFWIYLVLSSLLSLARKISKSKDRSSKNWTVEVLYDNLGDRRSALKNI